MKKVKSLILFIFIFYSNFAYANNEDFNNWLNDFKKIAIKNSISENTFELVMKNVKFLPKVIEYDRYQPEFYEDTKTYIRKRTSKKKLLTELNFTIKTKNLLMKLITNLKLKKNCY